MPSVQMTISDNLLNHVDRMFEQDPKSILYELHQNAHRAGAKNFWITIDPSVDADEIPLVVRDDGHGILHWQAMMTLGSSHYRNKDDLMESQDPAGIGWRCLKPRVAEISSRGHKITVDGRGWIGDPVEVVADSFIDGTEIRTTIPRESEEFIRDLLAYSPLQVWVNGEPVTRKEFFRPTDTGLLDSEACVGDIVHYPEFGVRVQICTNDWNDSLINFHGQHISTHETLSGLQRCGFRMEFTGEPTPLRLKLPDRNGLVHNEAWSQLRDKLAVQVCRLLSRTPAFLRRMSFEQYLQGRALIGADMPLRAWSYFAPAGAWHLPFRGMFSRTTPIPIEDCVLVRNDAEIGILSLLMNSSNVEPMLLPYRDESAKGFEWYARIPSIIDIRAAIHWASDPKISFDYVFGNTQLLHVDRIDLTMTLSDGRTLRADVDILPIGYNKPVLGTDGPSVSILDAEDLDDVDPTDGLVVVTPAISRLNNFSTILQVLGYGDDPEFDVDSAEEVWYSQIRAFDGPNEDLRYRIWVSMEGTVQRWLRNNNMRLDKWSVSCDADGKVVIHFTDSDGQPNSLELTPPQE